MPNSLAPRLLWVCHDLQVSDVLGRRFPAAIGKAAAWTGALTGSMPTESHPTPPQRDAALRMLEASEIVLGVGVWTVGP